MVRLLRRPSLVIAESVAVRSAPRLSAAVVRRIRVSGGIAISGWPLGWWLELPPLHKPDGSWQHLYVQIQSRVSAGLDTGDFYLNRVSQQPVRHYQDPAQQAVELRELFSSLGLHAHSRTARRQLAAQQAHQHTAVATSTTTPPATATDDDPDYVTSWDEFQFDDLQRDDFDDQASTKVLPNPSKTRLKYSFGISCPPSV